MLITLGALLALVVVVVVGWRAPWNVDSSNLGQVSERWLAEHRASHPVN